MAEETRIVEFPYKARDAFKPYHANEKRFCVTVAHRRAGKTVARINKLVRKAFECKLKNPRYAYIAPFYVQAKDIAWVYLKDYASPLLEYGAKVNESELTVNFPHNNAIIKLYGAENSERMRGLYADGIVIDEAQNIPLNILTTIILPSLADRKGWLDISGTPNGWKNMLGDAVKMAQANPEEWFSQVIKASETELIPYEELMRLKALMTEEEYEQEFECSFDAAIVGAYYGKDMTTAQNEGRICSVPYEKTQLVHTAWDLGSSDDTTVLFIQHVGKERRIIDSFRISGADPDYLVKMLNEKPYNYGDCLLPHDAANKLLASGSKSIEMIFKEMGVKNIKIIPRAKNLTEINDGIRSVRMLLNQCWFDAKKCGEGDNNFLDAMRYYRREWKDESGVFSARPKHDWSSHFADAMRCYAVGHNEIKTAGTLDYRKLYK
jgi:hypothetical protein